MRILTYCAVPFAFTHGGHQIQVLQTLAALAATGTQVEPLRWWDTSQTGDLIHSFGRLPADVLEPALNAGVKIVVSELLTASGSRSPGRLRLQSLAMGAVRNFAPAKVHTALNWRSYQIADAIIALTPWEAHLVSYLFGTPAEKVHVIPNGVEKPFLQAPPAPRGQWLVCTATITERKRVLELAQAAVAAQTPVWIIGKSYNPDDPYAKQFFALAREHPKLIRYEGAIDDRAKLAAAYREARGFVLLSSMESLSLSALEAAACECPLLLSDLPWATGTFKQDATYCPVGPVSQTAPVLRKFYDNAPNLPKSPKPMTWDDVARQIIGVYERVLSTSR